MPGTSLWRELPAANQRWLITGALVATVAINAAIAWLSVAGQDSVPMWGAPLVETSVFRNVVGTLFLLPLITSVLTTAAIRADIRRGADPGDLDQSQFVLYQTAFAVLLGILVTPPIAVLAMADPDPAGNGHGRLRDDSHS